LDAPRFSNAASPEFRKAFSQLSTWVEKNGGKVHASVVDLETDDALLRYDDKLPVNVASNAKIVTAAAALELLGPAYRFRTELFGDIDAEGYAKRLVIVGGGAPDLDVVDLARLIRVARGMGLSKVGDIVVDQSLFSGPYEPPAFDQQPREWAPFRANIAALSLNENAVSLNVVPRAVGQTAHVWYDPPGVVEAAGAVKTGPKGGGDHVIWELDIQGDRAHPVSKIGGSLAEGLDRRRYQRRLEDPRLAGGYALRALLEESGVQVDGAVARGQRAKEQRIARWDSRPLAELVRALGKDSNNFYAEMLFVALSSAAKGTSSAAKGTSSAAKGTAKDTQKNAAESTNSDSSHSWSSERGAQVVREYLAGKGVDMQGVVVKNGSGLFDANRYSTDLLVAVLASIEDNPRVFQDFVSHLAMGATDGTLERRMKGNPLAARIRAKTGTLRACLALSGYIQRTRGRSPAAFSLIVEGIAGKNGAVRAKMDQVVLRWAEMLEAS
jgi:D-alanyl-D-alanine carboxypeptidase/D-alanyl-D-alanine-endopeptidase (penicillin-binding protein 4)